MKRYFWMLAVLAFSFSVGFSSIKIQNVLYYNCIANWNTKIGEKNEKIHTMFSNNPLFGIRCPQ